jgi:hypothetical protein
MIMRMSTEMPCKISAIEHETPARICANLQYHRVGSRIAPSSTLYIALLGIRRKPKLEVLLSRI